MPYQQIGDLTYQEYAESAVCGNPCTILTLDNSVVFMGNVLLTAYVKNTPITVLPESMRPKVTVKLPVFLESELTALNIDKDGKVYLEVDADSKTLYLNGFTFNVSSSYYTEEIGNNKPNYSCPLNYEVK